MQQCPNTEHSALATPLWVKPQQLNGEFIVCSHVHSVAHPNALSAQRGPSVIFITEPG